MSVLVLVLATPAADGAEALAAYRAAAVATVGAAGGSVALNGKYTATLWGSEADWRITVALRFPDEAAARGWATSPDYQAAITHRNKAFSHFEAHIVAE